MSMYKVENMDFQESRVEKLPVWARDLFARMRSCISELSGQIATATDAPRSRISVGMYDRNERVRYLDNRDTVYFRLADSDKVYREGDEYYGAILSARIRHRHDRETLLEITGIGHEEMVVKPSSSNRIFIGMRDA